jgi:2-methylisocitrate lyase-like PEP mutase family enzyme
LEELAAHAKTIADAVRIPVIADAEAFDNAVPAFEAAGVAAIHIEDHTGAGKHTAEPQELHSRKEAAERIRAAVAARRNPAAAGANMVFPTMVGQRELDAVRRRIAKPIMIVDNPEEVHEGAAIVLYYALAKHRLASDTRPLEEFLGYKDAPGRKRR